MMGGVGTASSTHGMKPVEEPLHIRQSRWRSIRIMYLSSFVSSVSFSICVSSLYPYMKILDPSADTNFVGWIMAVFSIGQLLASPLFGIWSNRRARTREPLLAALTISILGSILYMELQSFRAAAKPLILIARLLTGISAETDIVLRNVFFILCCIAPIRSYVSGATTIEERTSAVSILAACQIVAFITGPLIQTAMVPIGYPDIVDLPGFHLDMYTATALFIILLSIINMALLLTVFREHRIDDESIPTFDTKYPIDDNSISKYDRELRIDDKSIPTFDTDNPIDDKSISKYDREYRFDDKSIPTFDTDNPIDDKSISKYDREYRFDDKSMSNGEPLVHDKSTSKYNTEHQVDDDSISKTDREHRIDGISIFKSNSREHRLDDEPISQADPNEISQYNYNLDYVAVFSTLAIFFSALFVFAMFETISTPMTMHMFAWTKAEATLYVGIVFGVAGGVAIVVCVIIVLLSKRFDERYILMGGFVLFMIGMFGYIPWGSRLPHIQRPHTATIGEQTSPSSFIPISAETTDLSSTIQTSMTSTMADATLMTSRKTPEAVGCPSHYDWCHDTPALPLWQYCVATFFLAIGYAANVITCSIYSKVLGPKPQGMWMGFLSSTGSLSRALGPVFVSQLYEAYGPRITFGSLMVWILFTILGILLVFRRLVPCQRIQKLNVQV